MGEVKKVLRLSKNKRNSRKRKKKGEMERIFRCDPVVSRHQPPRGRGAGPLLPGTCQEAGGQGGQEELCPGGGGPPQEGQDLMEDRHKCFW